MKNKLLADLNKCRAELKDAQAKSDKLQEQCNETQRKLTTMHAYMLKLEKANDEMFTALKETEKNFPMDVTAKRTELDPLRGDDPRASQSVKLPTIVEEMQEPEEGEVGQKQEESEGGSSLQHVAKLKKVLRESRDRELELFEKNQSATVLCRRITSDLRLWVDAFRGKSRLIQGEAGEAANGRDGDDEHVKTSFAALCEAIGGSLDEVCNSVHGVEESLTTLKSDEGEKG
eukprot:755142-Hanusia_phi.AAC.7